MLVIDRVLGREVSMAAMIVVVVVVVMISQTNEYLAGSLSPRFDRHFRQFPFCALAGPRFGNSETHDGPLVSPMV